MFEVVLGVYAVNVTLLCPPEPLREVPEKLTVPYPDCSPAVDPPPAVETIT
jgi:hypothetical protein